jgi:AmmeMemoRadiSam system protein B
MERPKLRKVERTRLRRGDEELLVLRDPLNLSEPVALDGDFAPVLDMLDGKRTLSQVRQSLLMGANLDVPEQDLAVFVGDLRKAGLLEGEHFQRLWEAEHRRFSAAPTRQAQLADLYYPADLDEMDEVLAEALPETDRRIDADSELLGVLCPHQPLDVAAEVLRSTLFGLPPAEAIDCVVVLGTDHNPGLLPYVLTSKDYETPLGPVPADTRLVTDIERHVDWVRREELRHRHCASLELSAVLLRAIYGDACPPTLFVLCGLTSLSTRDEAATQVDEFQSTLEVLLTRRRVLWWGSAELSHAGPAYGHPALDRATAQAVEDHDRDCLDSLIRGRPEQLVRRGLDDRGQGKPSGTATMATLARLLPVGYRAELSAYARAKPPGQDPGQIGMAGLRFFED